MSENGWKWLDDLQEGDEVRVHQRHHYPIDTTVTRTTPRSRIILTLNDREVHFHRGTKYRRGQEINGGMWPRTIHPIPRESDGEEQEE